MTDPAKTVQLSRRSFLKSSAIATGVAALGSVAGLAMGKKGTPEARVWQIDPDKCTQCGRCADACVLTPSAVKCVHAYDVCGYCNLCGGYHRAGVKVTDTAAENQLCPTAAIKRTFIEDPYYRYDIEEELCIGCAKCVKGCGAFGNGSLYLQIRHDRCVHCNQCAIASVCPSNAIAQVPADRPYRLRGIHGRKKNA